MNHAPDTPLACPYRSMILKNGLIRWLREHATWNTEPLRAHLAITQLPFHAIVTTGYDRILETALLAANKNVYPIRDNDDLQFWSTEQLPLIYLYGSMTDPATLVLTTDDHTDLYSNAQSPFFSSKKDVLHTLRGYFLNKILLFVGCDWNDQELFNLYRQHRDTRGDRADLQKAAFAVQLPCPISLPDGVVCLQAEPTQFFECLVHQVAGLSPPSTPHCTSSASNHLKRRTCLQRCWIFSLQWLNTRDSYPHYSQRAGSIYS